MHDGFVVRRSIITGIASLPLLALTGATDDSLARLIARNTRARGGQARLGRVRSMDVRLRIIEPTFSVVGHYRAERSGHVWMDVFAGDKRAFSEGVDANGVWSWPGNADAPVASSEKGRQALDHGVKFNLLSLPDIAASGVRITLVSADPPCLQLTFADGFETRMTLDPATWLIVRRQDRRAYHPDVDATEKRIESRYSDFRTTDGIVTPWLSEDYDLDAGTRVGRGEIIDLAWDRPFGTSLDRSAAAQA